jgi:L-ascorbate metabolism protein UlaG (beta-lactamase superfamily)
MLRNFGSFVLVLAALGTPLFAQPAAPKADEFSSDGNKLKIHFLGHATLIIEFNNRVIYVDPVPQYGPFDKFPKADLILITHDHPDHFSPFTVKSVSKEGTVVIGNAVAIGRFKSGVILTNGQTWEDFGIKVEAVPAYNTTYGHVSFHPKGHDNGYVLTLGKKRVYIAGDTEDIPEMAALKNIDIAFLPANQPYTMTPAQLLNAAKLFSPKILYPYHFGETNLEEIKSLFKDVKDIELRLRELK